MATNQQHPKEGAFSLEELQARVKTLTEMDTSSSVPATPENAGRFIGELGRVEGNQIAQQIKILREIGQSTTSDRIRDFNAALAETSLAGTDGRITKSSVADAVRQAGEALGFNQEEIAVQQLFSMNIFPLAFKDRNTSRAL